MISVIACLAGLLILGGGLYYLVREKADQEARKIYLFTALAGAVIAAGGLTAIVL